jgi:hypothetical protein
MPERIQMRRTRGWRKPASAIYVGRPTAFGNPFTLAGAREAGYIGSDAELRAMCMGAYRSWINRSPCDQDRYLSGDRWYDRTEVHARLHEIAGRDLACWCPLDQPCHVDVLLKLSNPRA